MQYLTFELDLESQHLCFISTPFGLYKYIHLPKGNMQSSHIALKVMGNLFYDLNDAEIYIDNVGCFCSTFLLLFKH
jgi:hypothetical protein